MFVLEAVFAIHVHTQIACTFSTWSKLLNNTYKRHTKQETLNPEELTTFKWHLCKELATKRDYFQHINGNLRHNETVQCMFVGCAFECNVYSTFNTHQCRKHNPHSLKDFKASAVISSGHLHQSDNSVDGPEETVDTDYEFDDTVGVDLPKSIEEKLLLKLEILFRFQSQLLMRSFLNFTAFVMGKDAVLNIKYRIFTRHKSSWICSIPKSQ